MEKTLITSLKIEHEEAKKALQLSKMMDAKEKKYWLKQLQKTTNKLENLGVNID